MVLLILNSPYHSIPLLILLIITVFDRFVLQRNSGKKVDEINSLEESVLKEKDIKNRYALLNQLHHNSYSYAFGISSRKCVYTFIIISCAFIMSTIQNTLTANALIFEFFMINVYFEYLDKLLGYVNEKNKYQKLLAHFIDTFVY